MTAPFGYDAEPTAQQGFAGSDPGAPATPGAPVPPNRQLWIILGTVVAVLLVAVPIMVFALLDTGGARTRNASGPHGPSEPGVTAIATTNPAASNATISLDELRNATLDLPPWPNSSWCPTSAQKFSGGKATTSSGQTTSIEQVTYVDVDHDGIAEAVARVNCSVQNVTHQVAVFDRNAAGQIVTLGQVVNESGDVRNIFDISAGTDAAVQVEVGDGGSQRQSRVYSWDGAKFRQTGGPTSFQAATPSKADLSVMAGNLSFPPPSSGNIRHGTVSVTVHNGGPTAISGYTLTFTVPIQTLTEGGSWGGCQGTMSSPNLITTCTVTASLASGASRTITFGYQTSNTTLTSGQVRVSFPVDDQKKNLVDDQSGNNTAAFAIKYS
jgi:hypothetical protein